MPLQKAIGRALSHFRYWAYRRKLNNGGPSADVHMAFEVADTDKDKVRQAVRTAINVLREVE